MLVYRHKELFNLVKFLFVLDDLRYLAQIPVVLKAFLEQRIAVRNVAIENRISEVPFRLWFWVVFEDVDRSFRSGKTTTLIKEAVTEIPIGVRRKIEIVELTDA